MKGLKVFFLTILIMVSETICTQNGLMAVNQRWWHLYYPNGTVDKGVADPKVFWKTYGLPEDMTGKRFYDLGCWDGGICFEAAHRGAKEVYGLDSYVWEIDPQQYQNFCNARDMIAPMVKDAVVEIEPVQARKWREVSRTLDNKHSIASFVKENGTADVVLAAGIVYHLIDPIKFLKELKLLVKPNTGRIYVTTWCSRENTAVASLKSVWRDDDTNYWIFSVKCMLDMLNLLGYKVEKVHEVINHAEPLMSFVCSVPAD